MNVTKVHIMQKATDPLNLRSLPLVAPSRDGWDDVKAAIAAGADGILVEVHPNPAAALSDGRQSLDPNQFRTLMADVHRMAEAMRRGVASPPTVPAQS